MEQIDQNSEPAKLLCLANLAQGSLFIKLSDGQEGQHLTCLHCVPASNYSASSLALPGDKESISGT